MTETFDLVISGGRVLDPGAGIDARTDVGIKDGKVAALGDLSSSAAAKKVDAAGKVVTPGLVDLHAHVYWGVGRGVDVDQDCLPRGVTTVADAGSSGSLNFPGFKRYIVDPAQTRIVNFLHLSYIGLVGGTPMGELIKEEWADPEGTLEAIKANPDVIKGVKVRLEERAVGERGKEIMTIAREVCAAAGVPLMVHICGATDPLAELLPYFAPGDIVTHMMTGRGKAQLLDEDKLIPQAVDARERGVVFDVAHGRSHFPFRVAERLIGEGFLPDAISTDVTSLSLKGAVRDMPYIMSKHLALGMSLEDVILASTSGPAKALGMEQEIGSLAVGREADIAVLELVDADELITDTEGQERALKQQLAPTATVRAGVLVA
ncbi:MAG: amidohydrolase/deacetylase family metallohydrolase [Mycobacterium sp.]